MTQMELNNVNSKIAQRSHPAWHMVNIIFHQNNQTSLESNSSLGCGTDKKLSNMIKSQLISSEPLNQAWAVNDILLAVYNQVIAILKILNISTLLNMLQNWSIYLPSGAHSGVIGGRVPVQKSKTHPKKFLGKLFTNTSSILYD